MLRIVYAAEALREIDEIDSWNRNRYGESHAGRYVAYILQQIDLLAVDPTRGKPVESYPEIRYVVIRRKRNGHGHLAVYRIEGELLRIVHVFHTAQDWKSRMKDERY